MIKLLSKAGEVVKYFIFTLFPMIASASLGKIGDLLNAFGKTKALIAITIGGISLTIKYIRKHHD